MLESNVQSKHTTWAISRSSPSSPPPVIIAPITSGQPHTSVAKGIEKILTSSLFQSSLSPFQFSKKIEGLDSGWSLLRNINAYAQLYRRTLKTVEQEGQALVLGGDHSLSFATVPAFKTVYPRLKILWVDAHTDINTPETSPTGNLHGMPIAALMGLYAKSSEPGWSWFGPCLSPLDIVYFGVRDTDPGEDVFLNQLGVRVYLVTEIRSRGLAPIFAEIKHWLADDPLLVSFDVDSLDPRYAPATGVPVPGGLNLQQAMDLAEFVRSTQQMVGLEVVEFDPDRVKHAYQVNLTRSCVEKILSRFY